MKLKQLVEQKHEAVRQMKEAAHNAKTENRAMSQEELQRFNAADADLQKIQSSIEAEEKLNALELDLQERAELAPRQELNPEQKRNLAFEKYAKGGSSSLSSEERGILKRANNTDIAPGTQGGYTVPTLFNNELIETMKYYAPMLEVGRLIRTASGANMEFTTMDDTANSASFIANQNTPLSATDLEFGRKTLGAHTAATMMQFSFEMMQDEAINLQSELARVAGARLGRLLEEKLTNGTGSGEPTGFIADAQTGVTAASATAITRGEIVDLIHSVDPAYRAMPSAAFMFNDKTLSALKQLTFASGDARPLWQPSIRVGEPDTLEGFNYVINQSMDDIGAGNKAIAFGEWNCFYIRESGAPRLLRLNERFADSLTVGFILYARYDSLLMKPDAIKVLANA